MRPNTSFRIVPACLAAVVLMAAGASMSLRAAPPALNGQISLRPLTPQEKKDYALPNAQLAGGLSAVGIGQPVYLDALVNIGIAPSNIVGVTWTLTKRPDGSAATLQGSPLGANVPTFKMADRLTLQVAGRTMLIPDTAGPDLGGQYEVVATITTTGSGSTNLTQKITTSTYAGAVTCSLCHAAPSAIVKEDTYTPWSKTKHAHAFEEAINGVSTDHFGKNCISCHVVGYDTNALAVNGGFDDIAAQLNWVFPTNISSGNWDAMPQMLKDVANIQCESCHGPGLAHAYAALGGRTNLSNWPRLGVTLGASACAQCHDSLSHHYKTAEWNNSGHAIAPRSPSGAGREQCVRCHTARGIMEFIDSNGDTNYVKNTEYEAITCSACHDPHDATHPHQLRAANIYTLPEGTTVTNVGLGALCMTCHHSRNGSAEQNVANYQKNAPTWAGGVSFGPHDSTAGDMVEGVNAITYGKVIPSGSHSTTIPDVCVGCHMQKVPATDPGFTKVGGHTFKMGYMAVANGVTNHVAHTEVCAKCHGEIEDFDMVRKDYNGDGVIEGIQTEVQKMLDRLSTMLPNSTYRADGNYVADGLVKTIGRTSVKTNWPTRFLNAAWNHMFVNVEGSHGIHNAPYAVGVLKASIADLTGDSNTDGLPDWWQTQYFASTTAANAGPNATPAGDGVPNWLKYGLGLDPMKAGVVLPDGVIWANAGPVGNPGATNTIQIYTAAEIVFNTEVGKTYQLEAISALGQGWRPVGAPAPGTGGAMSLVTPTRSNLQQYYRVVSTP